MATTAMMKMPVFNIFNLRVPYVKNWKEELKIELNREEAEFFKDAMQDIKDALYPVLLGNNDVLDLFEKSNNFIGFARQLSQIQIPESIKSLVVLAHDFAIVIEGAHIIYNREIQKHFFNKNTFDDKWKEWHSTLKNRMIDFDGFNPDNLFVYARTTRPYTVLFVKEWWKNVSGADVEDEKIRELIHKQEHHAKRNKARLKYNLRHDVREDKRLGFDLLDFRFQNVKRIVKDIQDKIV